MNNYDIANNSDFKEWSYIGTDGQLKSNLGMKERKNTINNLKVRFANLIKSMFESYQPALNLDSEYADSEFKQAEIARQTTDQFYYDELSRRSR